MNHNISTLDVATGGGTTCEKSVAHPSPPEKPKLPSHEAQSGLIERLVKVLQRYVANDHVHEVGCDELTIEAEAVLDEAKKATA